MQTSSGAQQTYSLEPGALSHGVKRRECESDHSPPPAVEIKNEWSCTYNPLYAFMSSVWTNTPLLPVNTTMTVGDPKQLSNFQLLKKKNVP
jgi:hypothetical protein